MYPLFVNGDVNPELPKTLMNALGPKNVEVSDQLSNEVKNKEENVKVLEEEYQSAQTDEERDAIQGRIIRKTEEIKELTRQREAVEERMSLGDRVRTIFKKYGFTVVGVVAAVETTLGVILTNLKNGLTSVAKGVGNGLKELGKKVSQILPGMVGAIASFIFKAAGEAVGFVAKNALLLIVAVVVYFVEKVKK